MKHIIAVLLENEAGALSRVVGLFSARGYNIESLTVAPTEDPSLSRMTIQTTGSDEVIEQITKHLNRLIEVVKVVDLTEGAYTERELMMVKVRAVGSTPVAWAPWAWACRMPWASSWPSPMPRCFASPEKVRSR